MPSVNSCWFDIISHSDAEDHCRGVNDFGTLRYMVGIVITEEGLIQR